MDTFYNDADRSLFLDLLSKEVEDGHLEVHAFALLPNHWHALATTPNAGLGRSMQRLLGVHAASLNRRHKRAGHLWQGRYKAILVDEGDYFLECSRYIHLNPIRAGLSGLRAHYPWSSCSNYLGGPAKVGWVSTERTLSYFPTWKDYRGFVEAGLNQQAASPFERARAGFVLGGEEFFQRIRGLVLATEKGSPVDVLGLREMRRGGPQPCAEAVRPAVSQVFAGYSACQQRRMWMYALHRLTWLMSARIAALAGKTPGAVTHCVQSLGQRLQQDPRLANLFAELVRLIRKQRAPT